MSGGESTRKVASSGYPVYLQTPSSCRDREISKNHQKRGQMFKNHQKNQMILVNVLYRGMQDHVGYTV